MLGFHRAGRRGIGFTCILMAQLACATESAPDPVPQQDAPDPLATLIERELQFARTVEESGIGPGFTEHVSPTGLVYQPGPTSVAEWLEANPAPAGSLRWVPTRAAVAAGGDLG